MNLEQQKFEYYKAATLQSCGMSIKPKYVPSKIRILRFVKSDIPSDGTGIQPDGTGIQCGIYECESNRFGAVSVVCNNGEKLGLKPSEFEILEFVKNKEAQK